MDTFFRFLYEFLLQFFSSFIIMFKGLGNGFIQMFNIPEYIKVINFYKDDFSAPEWILVVLAILVIVLILGGIIFIIYFLVRKYIRFRKTLVEQESLLEEVASLNNQVADLIEEKESILAMKVSHLGLKPGEEDTVDADGGEDNKEEVNSQLNAISTFAYLYWNGKWQNYAPFYDALS